MRSLLRVSSAVALTAFLTACGSAEADPGPLQMQPGSAGPIPEGAVMPSDHPPIAQLPSNHPDVSGGAAAPADAAPFDAESRTGTVLELENSGGYTYAKLQIEEDEVWVAGPETAMAVGDEIVVAGLMGMNNFYARSLDRTFDQILFASRMAKVN